MQTLLEKQNLVLYNKILVFDRYQIPQKKYIMCFVIVIRMNIVLMELLLHLCALL